MAETEYLLLDSVDARPRLLRRVIPGDQLGSLFRDGRWHPTDLLIAYLFGHDTDVEPISEAQARAVFPEAFGQVDLRETLSHNESAHG